MDSHMEAAYGFHAWHPSRTGPPNTEADQRGRQTQPVHATCYGPVGRLPTARQYHGPARSGVVPGPGYRRRHRAATVASIQAAASVRAAAMAAPDGRAFRLLVCAPMPLGTSWTRAEYRRYLLGLGIRPVPSVTDIGALLESYAAKKCGVHRGVERGGNGAAARSRSFRQTGHNYSTCSTGFDTNCLSPHTGPAASR